VPAEREPRGITGRIADVVRGLVGRFNAPQFAVRANRLHYDLYLTRGISSVPIFRAGELDMCRFFFRYEVPAHHDLEFVTSLHPDEAASESYQPYGLLRLGATPIPLPSLAEVEDNLARAYGYGLAWLPDPRGMLDGRRCEDLPAGTYWLADRAPQNAVDPAGRFSFAEVMDIVRKELSTADRIAWLEQCFPAPPGEGKIAHRYYLDRQGQIHLLRHTESGKTLVRAQNDEAALQIIWKQTRQRFG
jgi:hypothetical protein